ncbi:MAG: response regulator [Firmicutes bacterium]|nr:response regulator [Bacillota bacterium]
MRAIIVDDEPLMMRKFERLSEEIADLNLVGKFEDPRQALEFMEKEPVEAAFLDIEMPVMDGITLAEKLRGMRPDIIIVFITAYDEYIKEFNDIGGDYYIIKPYTRKVIENMMEKIRLLSSRQNKDVYIQTFGRFLVKRAGKPIRLTGKAKEILALVVTRHGKEISNEEIYSIIGEGRPYSNANMAVYYNALRRLREFLREADLSDLLISTTRGQLLNVDMVDCDYYSWKEKNSDLRSRFEGEFLTEYSWGELMLSDILREEYGL